MATPAIIKVEGITFAQVYKHWDGYPENMLPWLTTFNEEFTKERGVDPQYKFAQLLRSSTEERFGLDDSKCTGYGVIPYSHTAGASFEYILKDDGTVEVK
jgi:hypothetical protein